jgi:hypothetical protein
MANGNAALQVLAPEPPSTPDVPTGIEAVEAEVGEATAAAACAICQGLAEYQNGGLTSTTRAAGGERVAALYWLQQTHAGRIDFPAVARTEGRRVLQTYLDADFYRCHGPGAGEGTLGLFIDAALEVLAQVTAFERAFAN